MARWSDEITLLSAPRSYQDESGAWHEGEREERTVFCNVGMLGTMTMAQLRSSEVRINNADKVPTIGLTRMHVVWIRQIDYNDEDQVIFNGDEMDVIALTSDGDNYKMIIRKRLGND